MISWDVESQQATRTTPSTPALHEAKMACYFRHWPKPSSTFGEKVPVALDENFPKSYPTQVSIWENYRKLNMQQNWIWEISKQLSLIYLVQLHYIVILLSVGDCLHWPRAPGVWIWSQISGLPQQTRHQDMMRPLEKTILLASFETVANQVLLAIH